MQGICEFKDVSKEDVRIAGGKGASLGEMTQAGFPVPAGFVVCAGSMASNDELLRAYDALGVPRVAVRSSATVEDGSSASWAGQFETFLNVERDGLVEAVKRCRDSRDGARVAAYRIEQGLEATPIAVAVVVQTMVDADAAGVCFTVHPVTKNRDHMIIEACRGLGDRLVGGEVTPDGYTYSKATDDIVSAFQSDGERVLDDEQVHELIKLCRRIESHYGFPCDIEWAIKDGAFFILQSRPITTL